MDANEHTIDGTFRKMLKAERVGLVDFSHKSWGGRGSPNTYTNGPIPIDAEYRSPDMEVGSDKLLHASIHNQP